MATARGKQMFVESEGRLNHHSFAVYVKRNGRVLDYLGQAVAGDPVEAFKIVILLRHKIKITDKDFECEEIDTDLCRIWFKKVEYVVRRRI